MISLTSCTASLASSRSSSTHRLLFLTVLRKLRNDSNVPSTRSECDNLFVETAVSSMIIGASAGMVNIDGGAPRRRVSRRLAAEEADVVDGDRPLQS